MMPDEQFYGTSTGSWTGSTSSSNPLVYSGELRAGKEEVISRKESGLDQMILPIIDTDDLATFIDMDVPVIVILIHPPPK
ncbi:hypothetical protein H0H87_006530 [Tephrocybe sp. NHM501043]|nr:hypothetical protein H0H87_006530 [Tephrocybe sp. NHM501043]